MSPTTGTWRGAARPRRWLQRAVAAFAVISLLAVASVTSYGAWASRQATHAAASSPPAALVRDDGAAPVWYYGKTPAEVQALLGADNRLVGIDVAQARPLRLDVAMIANTGARRMAWWWLPGTGPEVEGGQVGRFTGEHEARIVSLAPYVVGGTTFFAAVCLGPPPGGQGSGWWWYFDIPRSRIEPLLVEHDARPLDLRSYSKGGTVYAMVMVPRHSDPGSWWYAGLTAADTKLKLSEHRATLTSLAPTDPTASTFDVVMSASPAGTMPEFDNVSWAWGTVDTD
jgi:hypothetical protein